MTTATHDVFVRKDIKLETGESLDAYASKIREAGTKFLRQKLNLSMKDAGCYPVEVFSKAAIFCCYNYASTSPEGERTRYYAVAYSRNDDGSFEFGTMTEVERVTSFQAKPSSMKVTKAVWSTATTNNLPDAAFAIILPGGKKDADGKTVPRSLRMLPHHTGDVKSGSENGSVDLAHLRNALARVSQAKMSAADKAKATAHLQAHAKELLDKKPAPVQKALDIADGWAPTTKALWGGVL